MSKYVESIVRTNKLHCSDCNAKINKGENVIFELNSIGRMKNVYGERCGCVDNYIKEAIEDSEHPFSSEALGQW